MSPVKHRGAVAIMLMFDQMYLITSAITFGIQILALLETKFPVWYPYSVTWFLGLLVESVLLIVPNILVHPTGPFDFVFIAIETLRILAFAILPILYFGLRNDEKEYDNNDAERQSLLRKNLAKKSSSSDKSVTNGKDYGTTGDTSAEGSETATNNSQTESEDAYLADQKKAMDMIAKRLKQDGDWFTYAKGFTVCRISAFSSLLCLLTSCRCSFLTFGLPKAKLYNSEPFWLAYVYWHQMR
jgi:hypothetical protein